MVHEWLVLELSIESTRVADAIPRFNTYKRCLLTIGAPEGNDRRAELYRHFWLAIFA